MHDDDPQGFPQGPNDDDLRREAGLEFIKRLDAHFRPPSKWTTLNLIAIDHENLPVVLRRMGFTKRNATHERGSLAWFPDPDWHIFEMARGAKPAIFIDIGSGRWRTQDGYSRGADLIALGGLMWGCTYGRAAHRIAQACGLRELPHAQ